MLYLGPEPKFYSILKRLNDPSMVEATTLETFQRIYGKENVQFSMTLDTLSDKKGGVEHTVVVCGDSFYRLDAHLENSGLSERIKTATDDGAHYIGFCAGAFKGANSNTASKFQGNGYIPYKQFRNSSQKPDLGMVDDACAVGPILPYANAVGHTGKVCMHTVPITTKSQDGIPDTLNTLYMEGPTFLDKSRWDNYKQEQNIVARYELDYELEFEFIDEYPNYFFKKTISLGKTPPAVLHKEKHGSHRMLFGPHPELAASKTFVKSFERQYSQSINPLCESDRNKTNAEEFADQNLTFLTEALGRFKM